jgi:hypothetical protein
MTNVACIVFFTLGLLVLLIINLAKLGSIWANVTNDLLVGVWCKVWLCRGPNNGCLITFTTRGKPCKGQPKSKSLKCVEQSRGVSHVQLPLSVDYSAARVTRAGLLSHCSWSPVVSQEAVSCWGRAQALQRVILFGEAGSGHTPTLERLALLDCAGSRNNVCSFNCSGDRQNNNLRAPWIGL